MRYEKLLKELKKAGYTVSYSDWISYCTMNVEKEDLQECLLLNLPCTAEGEIGFAVIRIYKVSGDVEEWMLPIIEKAKEHAEIVTKSIRMEKLF